MGRAAPTTASRTLVVELSANPFIRGAPLGLPCAGRAYATALPTIPQASSKATVGSMSMNASFGP